MLYGQAFSGHQSIVLDNSLHVSFVQYTNFIIDPHLSSEQMFWAPPSTSLFTLWGCLSSTDWGFKIHQLRCQLAPYLCLYDILEIIKWYQPLSINHPASSRNHPTYIHTYISHTSQDKKIQLPSALSPATRSRPQSMQWFCHRPRPTLTSYRYRAKGDGVVLDTGGATSWTKGGWPIQKSKKVQARFA